MTDSEKFCWLTDAVKLVGEYISAQLIFIQSGAYYPRMFTQANVSVIVVSRVISKSELEIDERIGANPGYRTEHL